MSEESYLRAVSRYSDAIRSGDVNFDFRTGQCGPVQATSLRSWGAACPAGFCPPDKLPEQLGRWFAGDRAGCREIVYTVRFNGTEQAGAVTTVTVEGVSRITMCPTRIMALDDDIAGGLFRISVIQFGIQNQIVGGPVPWTAFTPAAFSPIPYVPDCLKAGQPFTLTVTLGADATPVARSMWLMFIGPMVG